MKSIVACILLLILCLSADRVFGIMRSPNPDFDLISGSALPAETRQPAQDLLLYSNRWYSKWLYLEQEHGARLVVVDVYDPTKLNVVAIVPTGLAKPFDLIQVPNKHYAIARFRDGSGAEMLDLSRPRAPRLSAARPRLGEYSLPKQRADFPGIELRAEESSVGEGQDLEFVRQGAVPRLLAAVPNVSRLAYRTETGTFFLAGRQGLVIIRQHSIEEAWDPTY